MKKQLLSLSILLFSIATACAQITITNASFPFVATEQYQFADSSTVPGLNTAPNSFWDLGSVQKVPGWRETYYQAVSNHPTFTTANEKSAAKTFFGPIPANQNIYSVKNASGYTSLGINYDYQKIGIGSLSGFAADSITFPAQSFVFSTPFVEVPFPLTSGTKWNTGTRSVTALNLDIAVVSFVNTPAQLINYFNTTNEVIGYGTCSVPAKGSPSASINALLVKTASLRVDSFYINGAPANPFLLAALGLNQGDTVYTYQYQIFGENKGLQKLAIINFEDDSYTTVKNAEYSREYDVVSVQGISLNKNILVFPNPVLANTFTIAIDNELTETPFFAVYDVAGKKIEAQFVNTNGNNYQAVLPATTAKGVYFLQAGNDTKTARIKLLVK